MLINNIKTTGILSLLTGSIVALLVGLSACTHMQGNHQPVGVSGSVRKAERTAPPSPEQTEIGQAGRVMESIALHRQADMAHFAMPTPQPIALPDIDRENYAIVTENGVMRVAEQPVSTFSIDVDTASYANTRRMLSQGRLPPTDAVRVEEFINYFDYQYAQPDPSAPFSVGTTLSASPWHAGRHLLRVHLQGAKASMAGGSNLVFLVDVSGSMQHDDKLPLLKKALTMLVHQLDKQDKVSLVVYAGASGVVLEPTSGDQKTRILTALQRLQAGGSTNGAAGIELAYQLAEQGFIDGGVNRVLLATDGDFNVGMVDHRQLIDLIKRQRQRGIALTTLGFGQGNYNDTLMEQLADQGNGNYAYIDTINEARKVLVDEMHSTLMTLASDVKIQVEFNPATVAEYRLIGYENRRLAREDFNNDQVDAGEIGAGHRVTAFYEVVLTGKAVYSDPLRYGITNSGKSGHENELALVKLRYKPQDQQKSRYLQQVVMLDDVQDFSQQDADFRFGASVAGFAQLLRQSKYTGNLTFDTVIEQALAAKGEDPYGYRGEFIQLVRTARVLDVPVSEHKPTREPEFDFAVRIDNKK